MNVIRLTTKELVYLASNTGANEFFGISDPFFGMDLNEISYAVECLKQSLDKKGYMLINFDGSSSMNKDVASLIDICVECNGYITVDTFKDAKRINRTIYIGNEDLAMLSIDGENAELCKASLTDVECEITKFLAISTTTTESKSFIVPQRVINSAREAIEKGSTNKATKILAAVCDSEAILSVIVKGLIHKALISFSVATDLNRNKVKSAILIEGDSRAVLISDAEYSEDMLWTIKMADTKSFSGLTNELIRRIVMAED